MIRYARWLAAEVVYLAYRSGLRGYCQPCDRLRWAWTHRGHGCLGYRAGWYR